MIVENNGGGAEAPSSSVSEPAGDDIDDGTEGGSDEQAAESPTHTDSSNETALGVRVESPGAVTAAVIVSVALAGLLWRRPVRWVCATVVLVAAGATALDLAEISHQAADNRDGLAVLAAVILLHTSG